MSQYKNVTPHECRRLTTEIYEILDSVAALMRDGIEKNRICDCTEVRNIYTYLRNVELNVDVCVANAQALRKLNDLTHVMMASIYFGGTEVQTLLMIERSLRTLNDSADIIRQNLPTVHKAVLSQMVCVLPSWLRSDICFRA